MRLLNTFVKGTGFGDWKLIAIVIVSSLLSLPSLLLTYAINYPSANTIHHRISSLLNLTFKRHYFVSYRIVEQREEMSEMKYKIK